MALALNDRVQQTGTANTTVSFTLSASVTGFQTFAVIGDGNTTYYTATDASGNWEVGIGTYSTTGPTLTRDYILSSSSSGSAVTFSGTLNIWVDYPAEKSVNQDADGNVNILTYVPNTTTTIGTLNVGDGTYNNSLSGQIASFAGADDVVNGINVQNTSTSNTAYTAIQVGANNFNTGYYLQIGTNSSTYDYTAAGYPNSSINQPDTHYILANKADLGIATWDAEDIHFIQNASTATTDSMTLYSNGGVSLGGLPSPGIGNIACNNINLKFQQILTSGGTTYLTNASPYYTQFTGTNTENLQLPDATTCLVGTTLIFDNDSTESVDIKDGAGTTFELLVPGGFHTFVLEDNSTIAGTWLRYSQVPSAVEWGTLSLSLGATVISGGTWQGGTIDTPYGGTGLTSFTADGAVYATSSSTLTTGTLPVSSGGTGQTSFTSGYIPYGDSTAALQSSASLVFNGTFLEVGGGTPIAGATNPIAAFIKSDNNYVQTYVFNSYPGLSASADFVAYPDNGSDTSGFVDMGITSSIYSDASYSVTGPNEAYIFGSGAAGYGLSGNLVYATDSTGTTNAHQWYVGGFNQAKSSWKMQLNTDGLSTIAYSISDVSSVAPYFGMYKNTDGSLAFSINSNPFFQITASGAFAFGGYSTNYGAPGQVLTSTGDSYPSWSDPSTQWTTSGSDIYYNTGSVGIGTTTPGGDNDNKRLVISGGVSAKSILECGGSTFYNAIYPVDAYSVTNCESVADVTGTYTIGTLGSGSLSFNTDSTLRMRILPSGAVSFGSSGVDYGTTGQVLTSNGYAPPTWETPSSGGGGGYAISVIGTNTTAVKGTLYVLTASLTLTLPASPTAGDQIAISNLSGTTTAVIGRNGQKIMNLSEDMTVDVISAGITLVYSGATYGWVTI